MSQAPVKARSMKSTALKFVVLIGVMSFFADFTYEGSRGIIGPYLALLGAGAAAIGIVTGFGVHDALHQFRALFGPLLVAAVLAIQGDYRTAFAALLVPALLTLSILVAARLLYPRPQDMEETPPDVRAKGLPRVFWVYLA